MSFEKKAEQKKVCVNKVNGGLVSLETHPRWKGAILAKQGDDLRAEKIRKIKEQIQQGTYHIDASDVAKSIVRHEVTRLLGEKQRNHTRKKGGGS
jgi:anti-sigma28 factor (negative regulator of flagellin synthesis)